MVKPKVRDYIYYEKDIKKIVHSCATYAELLAVKGLVYQGFRISELVHFNRMWWRPDDELIAVPRSQMCNCWSCQHDKRHPGVWKTKSVAGQRSIPITPEGYDLFSKYFKEHDSVMEVIKSRVMGWRLIAQRVGKRAGLKLFPHALRGAFATMLAERKFTVYEIKDIMGWSSIEPAQFYVKISASGLKSAMKEKWGGELNIPKEIVSG